MASETTAHFDCPKCDTVISRVWFNLSEEKPSFDIMNISQTDWKCPNCKTLWAFGDLHYEDMGDESPMN